MLRIKRKPLGNDCSAGHMSKRCCRNSTCAPPPIVIDLTVADPPDLFPTHSLPISAPRLYLLRVQVGGHSAD